jgi:hypothetical protein
MNDKTGRGVAEAEEITEYGVQRTEERQVQRCKSADGRCKGGKMNDKTGRGVAEAEEITEYGVQRTEERQVQRCKSADGRWKSGKVGQGRLQSAEYGLRS